MSSLAELSPDNDEFWEFARWGEKVIAVCGHNNVPRIITFGDSVFADLSGTPPNARHVAVVRNFVVMGNNRESGTIQPQRIRWSGINDETNWTTDKSKQSDFQDLLGNHGGIQAIRGGEYGVIFMEHAIWVMDYIGPPQIFSFDETLPGIGTPAPNSVVQRGDACFLLSQNGFISVVGGRALTEIGANKINKWFYDNVDPSYINRVVGAWDKQRRHIKWIFPSSSTAGLPNQGVVFDLQTGKWSHFEDELEWIFPGLGSSLTLDQLDTISTSLDDLPASLDSNLWITNDPQIVAFDENHKSGSFEGDAMDATIDSTEAQLLNGRALVTRTRLEATNPGTATVKAGTRVSQSDVVSFGNAVSQANDGSYPMRSESRYHRFRAEISGGFDLAQGIDVEEAVASGGR